jgi:hypothetical protein
MGQMEEARAVVHSVVRGLDAGVVDRPIAPGVWGVREHLLHLHTRDLLAIDALELAVDGVEPEWAHFSPDQNDRLNEERLAPLRASDWRETLRMLDEGRDRLMEAIDEIPAGRSEMWDEEHALGAMLLDLAANDAHHAEIIRHWRLEQGI